MAPVSPIDPVSVDAATAKPAAPTDVAATAGAPPVATHAASRCEGVRLSLRTRPNLEGGLTFVGALLNEGPRTVTLVEPGDGSDAGWRTPIITLKVERPDGTPVPEDLAGRCGNMNGIREREIFDLAPRGHHVLSEWLGAPRIPAGRYVIRVVYENDPALQPLHGASAAVLRRMAGSTPCTIESNAVSVAMPEREPAPRAE